MTEVRSQLVLYVALLMCTGVSALSAQPKDSPLQNYISGLKRQNHLSDSRLSLSAVGVEENGHLLLSFQLKNISPAPITMTEAALPWGNSYSIVFVALTPRGQVLPMGYPIDDVFGAPSVTMRPGEILTGNYDLSRMLLPDQIPADTDLVVLWRYSDSIPDSGISEFNGLNGVAVVHTPKKRVSGMPPPSP